MSCLKTVENGTATERKRMGTAANCKEEGKAATPNRNKGDHHFRHLTLFIANKKEIQLQLSDYLVAGNVL